MALKPENPVVGGTVLRRAAIQSPNFVTGVSGWSVNQDGSAEFNNVVIRNGQVVSGTALFYSGTPAAGKLVASIAAAPGFDPFGNTYLAGITSYDPVAFKAVQLTGAQVVFFSAASQAGPYTQQGSLNDGLWLEPIGTGIALSASGVNDLLIQNGTIKALDHFSVIGSAASEQVYIEQDGTTGHGLTVNLVGSGGASQAAINAVSANSAFSAVEITGTETNRGTLKIKHQGYANGSDSSASAISIDLQTTVGGVTGTNAQGIFITSTTDTIPGGNALTVRYNSQDWFVVKGNVGAGNGIVGIGVATGHIPQAMLEIVQKDTTTTGFTMTALAGGTDMISLKDSGGTLRWNINNAGNMSVRANAFFSTNAIIGSVSGDFGGAGSALTICHTTDPSSNPAAGHVILFVDATGNLKARGSSGTITTIAVP